MGMNEFDDFEDMDEADDMEDDIRYSHIRCPLCDARMFDTTGLISERDNEHIEVLIKCYRCRQVNRVYLSYLPEIRIGMLPGGR